ncbi:thermonuclease family protein [Atribacter laminatus]|uniref:TNase-like domain-containing protein n=1 Tax=Atribacter laminatus TaxID=2847778 RepID=A0A7T1ALA0_ATRLM|nr:hypothetical protein [Atribacter laminatus]QPM67987.1 hypothetical protein RT761_01201 [Atribacter laminatus]
MAKKAIFIILTIFFVCGLAEFVRAQENIIPVTIIRVSQPNIVTAEYCCGREKIKVRIKLAGVKPPIAYAGIADLLKEKLRKFIHMPGVSFDFALGHNSEEKVWVGYLSYLCHCESEDDEIAIINAELIAEGLAEVDEDTAGRNMINYLLGEQDKACSEKKGLWLIKEDITASTSSGKSDCPSCER